MDKQLFSRSQLTEQGLIKGRVLATGVFDCLHFGHIKFLTEAKKLARELWVGVESDRRVKLLKGEGRPYHNQEERLLTVRQLVTVDAAFILPEDFSTPEQHLNLLTIVKPEFLAVSTHTAHLLEKKRMMQLIGGKVIVALSQVLNINSTKIISQFRILNT